MTDIDRFSIPQGNCEITPKLLRTSRLGTTSYLLHGLFDRRLAESVPLLWLQGLVGLIGAGVLANFGQMTAACVVALIGIYLLGSWFASGKGRVLEIPRDQILATSLHDGAPPVVPPFLLIEYADAQGQQASCRMPLYADKTRRKRALEILAANQLLPPTDDPQQIEVEESEDDWDEEDWDEDHPDEDDRNNADVKSED